MKKKPNIILITIDALRADHLGFMNYKKDISPNLDKLAKESSVFINAFSVGPVTPHSFLSIITSTYPLDYQGAEKIERPRVLISEVLKEQNFVTTFFSTNPWLTDHFGYNKGWLFFEDLNLPFSFPQNVKKVRKIRKIELIIKGFLESAGRLIMRYYPELVFRVRYLLYKLRAWGQVPKIKATFINQITKDFIHSVKEQPSPFFLWIHYMDVHGPYLSYRNHTREKPVFSYPELVSKSLPRYFVEGEKKPLKRFIKKYLHNIIDLYDQGIKYLDEEIGDLLVFLKEENVYQNTIICLTADHGEEFFEHGEGTHEAKLYNELLHVPLLIKTAEGKGKIINKKVSLIDLAPTLCDLVGIKPAPSFKGKSLFEGNDEIIFHQTGYIKEKNTWWTGMEKLSDCKLACQSNDWKYIIDYSEGREELYNFSQDPKEQNNLAQSQPEILSQMRKRIQKFKEENPPLSLINN